MERWSDVSIQPSVISYPLEERKLRRLGRWKNSDDVHDSHTAHREMVRALQLIS